MSSIRLQSPLPPEECAQRLAAAIDPEFSGLSLRILLDTTHSKPVIGSVEDFSLRLRKRINYRNSFQAQLTARLQPAGMGTMVVGRVGAHPAVFVFMTVWLGFISLIGIPATLTLIRSLVEGTLPPLNGSGNEWAGLLIPPGLLVLGVCFFAFGRFLARGENDYLVAFVARTLDAEIEPGDD